MIKILEEVAFEVPNVEEAISLYRWFLNEEPIVDSSGTAHFFKSGFRLVRGRNPNRNHYIIRLSDDVETDYQRLLELGAISRSPSSPDPMRGLTDYEFNDPWGNIVVLSGAGRLSS